jgi:UDP-N-acetylenolpyruvoylglucosamine reductase
MGTIEGEEVQEMVNIIYTTKHWQKISQISRKRCPFRYRRPSKHQTDLKKIENLHSILSLK